MSIFPTRILLATDGSGEAGLAATTAADLATTTGSELHVVHVGHLPAIYLAPTEVDPAQPEREARELLDAVLGVPELADEWRVKTAPRLAAAA